MLAHPASAGHGPVSYTHLDVYKRQYANGVKMCMKHTIEFPIEEDLNELELIKTTIGNGK